jgi:hypothetical protein
MQSIEHTLRALDRVASGVVPGCAKLSIERQKRPCAHDLAECQHDLIKLDLPPHTIATRIGSQLHWVRPARNCALTHLFSTIGPAHRKADCTFHQQMGMAALNAGKHLFCEWPLAATTEQSQQLRDLAARKGVRHMVGLQARAINRVRDLVAEGYVGKVLSCTMIVTTPGWGTDFTLSRAYLADRSTGATLMTIPGGHSIDALCFCLGEFKEVSNVVATQRPRVKIVETGETIQMTSPDQVLLSGVLQSGAVASVHIKGGTANGTGFLFEIHGTKCRDVPVALCIALM